MIFGKVSTVLLLLCLPFWAKSECSVGTLACSTSKVPPVPLLCDFVNSFMLTTEGEKCVKVEISNCSVVPLVSSATTCFACADGFRYDLQSNKCVEIGISNCLRQDNGSSNSCSQCKPDHYIDGSECKEIPPSMRIPNCAVSSSQSECAQCAAGFYLSEGVCLQIEAVRDSHGNCRSFRQIECAQCPAAYFRSHPTTAGAAMPDLASPSVRAGLVAFFEKDLVVSNDFSDHTCLVRKVAHCVLYDTPSTCQACAEGYPLTEAGQCEASSSSQQGRAAAQTVTCLDGQVLHPDGNSCIDLPENCVELNVMSGYCLQCNAKFYLKQGKCDQQRDLDAVDPNCRGNALSNSNVCTSCNENHFVAEGAYSTLYWDFPLGCSLFDRVNRTCLECAAGKNLNAEGQCEDGEPESPESPACAEVSPDTGVCLICAEGYVPYVDPDEETAHVDVRIFGETCKPVAADKARPGHCQFHRQREDGSLECVYCERGFVARDGVCVPSQTEVLHYSQNMDTFVLPPAARIPFCRRHSFVESGRFACNDCIEGYIRVVDPTQSRPTFDVRSAQNGRPRLDLAADVCAPENQLLSHRVSGEADAFLLNTRDCAVAARSAAGDLYCLRCAEGFRGRVVRYFPDESGDVGAFYGVGGCRADGETSTRNDFAWQEFDKIDIFSQAPLSLHLEATNCARMSDYLVVHFGVDDEGALTVHEGMLSRPLSRCVDRFDQIDYYTNISFMETIPHCQIFASSETSGDPFKIDRCLACRPGYRPVYSSGLIGDCIGIEDCDTSYLMAETRSRNVSQVLNGCSTARVGIDLRKESFFSFDSLADEIDVSDEQLANCAVWSSSGSGKCLICKPRFWIKEGKCIDLEKGFSANPRTLPENCLQLGYPLTNQIDWMGHGSNGHLVNFAFALRVLHNFQLNVNNHCMFCQPDHLAFASSVEPVSNTCVASQTDTEMICANHLVTDGTCIRCAPGYQLNLEDNSCIGLARDEHCLIRYGPRCLECDNELRPNGDGCEDPNCQLFFRGECALCRDGFRATSRDLVGCEANPDAEDPCLAYSPRLGTCGRCRDDEALTLIYDTDTRLFETFLCGEVEFNFDLNGWRDYDAPTRETMFLQVDLKDSEVRSVRLNYLNADGVDSMKTAESLEQNPAQSVCLYNRNVLNCHGDHFQRGVYCSVCKEGSTLDTRTNQCRLGGDNNGCAIFDPMSDRCKVCKTLFWIDDGECRVRQYTANCEAFVLTQDRCFQCESKYKVDSSGVCISEGTGPLNPIDVNCNKVSDGVCVRCKTQFYLDGSVCRPIASLVENCQYYRSATTCAQCVSGFSLKSDGSVCTVTSLSNCEVYKDKNTCAKCAVNHVRVQKLRMVDGEEVSTIECESSDISKCLQAISGSVRLCLKCDAGYVPSDDFKSCLQPSSISNCSEYHSPRSCLRCRRGYVRSVDWGSCERVVDATQQELTSVCESLVHNRTLACEGCRPGFRMDAVNDCVSCSKGCGACAIDPENTSSELCSMCNMGYYMNEKGLCQPIRVLTEKRAAIWMVLSVGLMLLVLIT